MILACRWAQKPSIMAEKPRFRWRTVFAKNLGFGVGFGYRNNTKPFWILMKQEMMGGSGISWTMDHLYIAVYRQPCHHLITWFLQARCLLFLPTLKQQCQSTEGKRIWPKLPWYFLQMQCHSFAVHCKTFCYVWYSTVKPRYIEV